MIVKTARSACAVSLAAAALALPQVSSAQDQESVQPTLATNQAFLEELRSTATLEIDDIQAVFAYILLTLPDEVTVYPTENYYYFQFYHGSIQYAGNIRLAASDRDKGLVHFAYFPAANPGVGEGKMHYKPLSSDDGVGVEKLGPLHYAVSFKDRRIQFLLNDLSDIRPPDGFFNENEHYLGPVFDESGIEFFLVFNRDLKIFHYVLNETDGVTDRFRQAAFTDRIVLGRRTGFAFYRDPRDRKILIGVLAANVAVNNYYDGPFDQLPDNFNKNDDLKNAIETADPSVAGRIDRFGYFMTGEGRYLIGPYLQYSDEQQLVPFHLCATNPQVAPQLYYGCLAVQGGG